MFFSILIKSFFFFQSITGHTTSVECVRFDPREIMVCAGSLSGALKVCDLEASKSKIIHFLFLLTFLFIFSKPNCIAKNCSEIYVINTAPIFLQI